MPLAWGLVLRSFTGLDRVCFGFRTSGRDGKSLLEGLRNSVGCIENTVPLSMELFAYKSIQAALRDAKETMLCSLDYLHIHPSEIEQALQLKGVQLFNTCMTYVEHSPELRSRFNNNKPQLQLSCNQSSSTYDKDLSLSAMFVDGRLSCSLSQRILSDAHAQSLTIAFRRALNVIVTSPSTLIGGCLRCEDVGMIGPQTPPRFKEEEQHIEKVRSSESRSYLKQLKWDCFYSKAFAKRVRRRLEVRKVSRR